jgi:CHAT domain-containing protein
MLRYRAHVLLGQSAELAGDQRRASRCYHAAAATVDRIQHGLTIALRAQFMGDHGEASRALINLLLRSNRAQAALYALERAKAQVLLAFLGHHHQYRWPSDSARSQALISELEQLRNEHQRYYYLLYEHPAPSEKPAGPDAEQLRAGVAARERRMRAITEQLYLLTPEGKAGRSAPPALGAIQQALGGDSLIEFYDDGRQLWAFLIDADGLAALPLTLDSALLNQRVGQLYANISSALTCHPGDAAAEQLTPLVKRTLGRLHEALLGPLLQRLRGRRRLFIVPYGGSHFVPFNLLHDGDGYLVESHEVVVLPAASALMRPPPRRPAGARVLAHSWSGQLSHAIREGELVSALWDGELHAHAAARRSALAAPPTQILHIAAHGEYRFDAPDFSYIRLDDGQLFIDDILQNDVSYELITLSACQTGRAQIVGGDEVIGLGRSFLYAGAGAVIAGLWQVPDQMSLELMGDLYGALRAGAARSAALRQAQRAQLAANPALHPAFWGAFQLIGDAGPLSSGGPA